MKPSLAGRIHFDDINLDKEYKPEVSYYQSKLANVLFARELAARLQGIFQCTVIFSFFFFNVALLKAHALYNACCVSFHFSVILSVFFSVLCFMPGG